MSLSRASLPIVALVATRGPEHVPLDCHPVAVYLASLSAGSRRSMAHAVGRIAELASNGACRAESFPWTSLRYSHTAAIRAALAERFAPATANRMLSALRGVLKECWRLGYVAGDDYQRAVDLKAVPGRRLPAGRMLTSGELTSLFRSCATDGTAGSRLDAAIVALLVGCGLRRAEAAALDLGDYDGDQDELRLRSAKGSRQRIVPIVNGQRDGLEAWLDVRGREPGPLLCPVNKSGAITLRRMTDQAIYMRLQSRAARSGVKPFTPHDLRRTFVSALLDHGADISAVQRLAGHASVATTTRYDRRDEKSKRRAAELLHVPFVAFQSR